MQLRRLTVRGDTIVEVLIAIAVAGAALGGAYALVNANVKSNQLAQERSVAVKVAESQIELLRSYIETHSLPTGNFCLNNSTKTNITVNIPSTDDNDYPNNCKQDGGLGVHRYMTGIDTDASDPNKFTVYVNWDDPTGSRAQTSIAYKVYK
jgi:type II secretory pathway pseudopilin PulG